MDLSYIIEKIKNAELSEFPFKHIEINELFEKNDFEEIIRSPEIAIKAAHNDEALFEELFACDYRVIGFPGCTINYKEYIKWHREKKSSQKSNTSCQGYGVVLRLQSPKSNAIKVLQNFINSREFIDCISKKFNIKAGEFSYDAGIQKYLDGYEISPHPDIRKKALTYMVNINPSPTSFDDEYHTSYLQFKPEWNYVREFWQGNENYNRCWVPWDWCEVKKQQRRNNSIVIFSPDNDTLHAVKANYNHLSYQRTQLYGNLWFRESLAGGGSPKWEDFVIEASPRKANTIKSVRGVLKNNLPTRVVTALKRLKGTDIKESTHVNRNID